MAKKKNEIALRPSYWASVSGGKDSLYMLNYILHNLNKYPLDGVVHFELEIDYPFIHDVIDYMESECKRFNIPFYRFKPRKTWEELYELRGFPTRVSRWCNHEYKMTAKKELENFLNSKGYYSICYIGYCYDEEKRWSKRKTNKITEIYPLVEAKILEKDILDWAKDLSIYNDYYKYTNRCGCMYCPLASMSTQAYTLKYYPKQYEYMMSKARKSEIKMENKYDRPFSVWGSPKYNTEYRDKQIREVWLPKLESMINDKRKKLF